MPTTPVIVVGVGGTGMKTLLQLKRLVAGAYPEGMASLPAVRLLCIDSDDLLRPSAEAESELGEAELGLDPANEFLKLEMPGNVGFGDLDRARSWFPRELEYYIPDLSTGCKQYKPLGRLMYAWNYGKVLRAIEPLRSMVDSNLLKALGVTEVDDPLIFVVASLCGGTGAGIFLDLGYTLSNLWKRKWTRFNTKVSALLALPSVFGDITLGTERIRSNAYASLKELDHFMNKDVYTDPDRAFRTDYPYAEQVQSFNFAPFDRVFLFDNSNGRVSISSGQVYEMMARYIFLMVAADLAQDYNSVDNNLTPKVRGTNRLLNKPTCYSSFGYYSVVFPRQTAVRLAAADLALDLASQELASPLSPQEVDARVDAFLTGTKLLFSDQSPQLLHALSFYQAPGRGRVNIQDTISSTVAGIDLSDEPPQSYEATVREYDTRFTNTDLALFEADCRREASVLLKAFRSRLEAEIQRLADPAHGGSIREVHLFLEELHRELAEDAQALERLQHQTERQLPGLKSALETQILKLRETAASKGLLALFGLKGAMAQVLTEARETLESYWLARRKATIARHALAIYRGDPAAGEADLRSGVLDLAVAEREAYRRKIAALEHARERAAALLRRRRSVPDGEFYKVVFDYARDVQAVIDEVKVKKQALSEMRRAVRAPEVFGSDLDRLAEALRLSNHPLRFEPQYRDNNVGFRCALDALA